MIENDIKSQACVLKHALCMGLIDVAHIVTWANTLINNTDVIAEWLADLSLRKSNNQAILHLEQVPGKSAPDDWWPVLKQRITTALMSGTVEPQTVATYCYNLALSGEIPAYDCAVLYQFELEYDSIFSGYGTQAEVDAQVVRFFNKRQ